MINFTKVYHMENIFAINLKNLRIEKGLKQTELAEKLFINKSMISAFVYFQAADAIMRIRDHTL